MATKKTTRSSSSSKAAGGAKRKKRSTASKAKSPRAARAEQIRTSVILFVLGALLTAMAFVKGETLWFAVRQVYFGVFGSFAYVLGLLVLYWAALAAMEQTVLDNALRALALCLALCGTLVVFTGVPLDGLKMGECAKVLFENGKSGFPGGGLAGVLGGLLLVLCGRLPACIIVLVLLIACLMLFTGMSMGDLYQFLEQIAIRVKTTSEERREQRRLEREEEEYLASLEQEEEVQEEPVPQKPARRLFDVSAFGAKKRSSVDIDLGPDPTQQTRPVGIDSMDQKPELGPGGTFGLEAVNEIHGIKAPVRESILDVHTEPAAPVVSVDVPEEAVDSAASEQPSQEIAIAEDDDVLSFGQVIPAAASAASVPAPAVGRAEAVESTPGELAALIQRAVTVETEEGIPAEDMPAAPAPQYKVYVQPPIDLFDEQPEADDAGAAAELKEKADKLVKTLEDFGVKTRVINISRGPTVTRYELQPLAGVKISKITSLADDIALNLAAGGVRIEAPIPGKPAVGVEVPNTIKESVSIRGLLESNAFVQNQSPLSFCLGKDIGGEAQVADLYKMPHLLIAGSTGSGKSVCVNSIIMSIISRFGPEDVKMLLIDPKVVELAEYNSIPQLLMPVVTEPKKAAAALSSAVAEMERRYHLFAENSVREIKSYNKLAKERADLEPLPYIAIVIDELADLMMVAGKQVEESICRIAQKARAAGMHLIVATQRPSVDVITGLIKANIPSRIAFRVSSQIDSRTILDAAGAEKLLGMGDMLFMPVGAPKPVRIQGCFVKDEEISRVLEFVKANNSSDYDENMSADVEKRAEAMQNDNGSSGNEAESGGDDGMDPMLKNAVEVLLDVGQASTSLLQRRCKLGYARAARLMDEMEQLGIIGPFEGAKPRQVLITKQQWIEMCMRKTDEANSAVPEEIP